MDRCEACKDGYVSREGSLHCLRCPASSEDSTMTNTCECPDGQVWNWDSINEGSCKPCGMGTYKNKGQCKGCPRNTTSSTGASYCECKAGEVWINDTCEKCGYVSRGGSLQCLRCPSGYENNTCECSKGLVWVGDSEGKCLPIISHLHIIIKTLKAMVGVLTFMTCILVFILILRERGRRASEQNMAPIILITEDDSSEYMKLTGGTESQPLEETMRETQAGEEGEYVAFQITAEALEDENHIYEEMM